MKVLFQFIPFYFIFNSFWLWSNVTVLNGLTHVHNAEKGVTFSGVILVQNSSKERTERITFYMEDIEQLCSGETKYLEAGNLERSIHQWVSFSTTEKILRPNETFSLVYTITVPKETVGSSPDRGSFWGTVMVEASNPINEEEKYGVQIASKIRYGVQLILNVTTPESAAIDFLEAKLSKAPQAQYALDVKLQNNGIYVVQPFLNLELFKADGSSITSSKVKAKKIYPGSCKTFKILLSDLPEGVYDGVLVADHGGEMFGINLEINTASAE
jgi:hypothetical protein